MNIKTFTERYRQAFGNTPELPVAFWYSEEAASETQKEGGCFFKHLNDISAGKTVSLNADNIGCGGGKFYTGFSDMPEHVPNFVSVKERYKQTPELVLDMIEKTGVRKAKGNFLNFSRIDNLESFEGIEGLFFLATPDVLSGLVSWTTFDRNETDVVSSLFGSGCSNVVTQTVNENATGGYRSFIGFFDPSVRPWIDRNVLSFSIPMSRFRVMYDTMPTSCLFDTHAWGKVRERIENKS